MPRRNRKGRRPGQRPRLFHPESRREARRNQRELETLLSRPPPELSEPPAPPPLARECGNCLDWVAPAGGLPHGLSYGLAGALAARGRCIHPASGVLAPPADTPACPHFTPRR